MIATAATVSSMARFGDRVGMATAGGATTGLGPLARFSRSRFAAAAALSATTLAAIFLAASTLAASALRLSAFISSDSTCGAGSGSTVGALTSTGATCAPQSSGVHPRCGKRGRAAWQLRSGRAGKHRQLSGKKESEVSHIPLDVCACRKVQEWTSGTQLVQDFRRQRPDRVTKRLVPIFGTSRRLESDEVCQLCRPVRKSTLDS